MTRTHTYAIALAFSSLYTGQAMATTNSPTSRRLRAFQACTFGYVRLARYTKVHLPDLKSGRHLAGAGRDPDAL